MCSSVSLYQMHTYTISIAGNIFQYTAFYVLSSLHKNEQDKDHIVNMAYRKYKKFM